MASATGMADSINSLVAFNVLLITSATGMFSIRVLNDCNVLFSTSATGTFSSRVLILPTFTNTLSATDMAGSSIVLKDPPPVHPDTLACISIATIS